MAHLLDIEPIDATFGAVVRGVKVTELDEPTFRALYDAWLQYALLIFPDQYLKRDQQIAFAKRATQWEQDTVVSRKMVFDHYFGPQAKPIKL